MKSFHPRLLLAVLSAGALMQPLDFFIVNLALPAIRDSLGTSSSVVQLILSAYASGCAAFMITGGRLGDLFGRKRMFMAGMIGFVLASVLCSLASTGALLVAGRILQALCASLLGPQVLATIRTVYDAADQPRVMSRYGFVIGLSPIIGQLGGGLLIHFHPLGLGWQSIFLVNVPIGIVICVGAWFLVPESVPPRRARLDLQGLVLLSVVLLLIICPLTLGRDAGWPMGAFVSLAASVPVFLLFLFTEKRIAERGGDPLVNLALFRNPAFSIGLAMAFLFYCPGAILLAFGIYLQSGLGWSALASAVAIVPYALGFACGPLLTISLVRRVADHVLSIGIATQMIGLALMAASLVDAVNPGVVFYVGFLAGGLGQGIAFPSLLRIVLREAAPEMAGLAAGTVSSTLQIGAAFGVATIGGLFFLVLDGAGLSAAGYARAFQVTAAAAAGCLLVCLVLCLYLVRRQGVIAKMQERLESEVASES
jgi:MFS family permease